MQQVPNLGRKLLEIVDWIDHDIPESLRTDPETSRRAQLITRFGVLGFVFGFIYASFYLIIGHNWGALIVALCTIGVAATPSLMVLRKSIEPAGHFFALNLTMGFFGLCCVEGGAHGHAIAWLVSIPLCALVLLGQRAAVIWLAISFLAATLIISCDLMGIALPKTYAPRWEPLVSAAGYLGLGMFLSILGLIFERGRAQAQARMQEALQKLAESKERLVGLNAEKTEFLGIAAHDLKNPLTVIMGHGELMKLIDEPEILHRMVDQVILASQRMHHLIKNLLDANAIEEGRFASKIEPCGMGPLVSQIVEQNRISAERKQIEIRLGVYEDLIVRTDSDATLQILDNLVSNAVKYSPANSTIHVHLVPEEGHALVLVRDEGPGISEEDQKKLFQKFSRLTARPTGGESSTGLGLSIAKKLAQTLGGDILCQSTLGAGTTFVLRLPLGQNAVERPGNVHEVDEILRELATYSPHLN
jgi:signal transduction histidine kinase